jgi:hypothetical protein
LKIHDPAGSVEKVGVGVKVVSFPRHDAAGEGQTERIRPAESIERHPSTAAALAWPVVRISSSTLAKRSRAYSRTASVTATSVAASQRGPSQLSQFNPDPYELVCQHLVGNRLGESSIGKGVVCDVGVRLRGRSSGFQLLQRSRLLRRRLIAGQSLIRARLSKDSGRSLFLTAPSTI